MADLGVYLHVPFCRRRCDYCAFATYSDRDHLMRRYLEACRVEVRRAVAAGRLTPATSMFVGGGTPSRVPAEWLCSVLSEVPRRPGAEVTVECNPEDVDADPPRRVPGRRGHPGLHRRAVDGARTCSAPSAAVTAAPRRGRRPR